MIVYGFKTSFSFANKLAKKLIECIRTPNGSSYWLAVGLKALKMRKLRSFSAKTLHFACTFAWSDCLPEPIM
jgi:hypothetical protein